MSKPEPTPSTDPEKRPAFRLKPSRNQKKRSKLQQNPDESSIPNPEPQPVAPPPAAPRPASPSTPLLQRNRLKRSGQMREDLLKPPVEEGPAEPEPEY